MNMRTLRKLMESTVAKTKIDCLNCQKETYVENKEIQRGFGKFCSRKCNGEYKSKNVVPQEPNVSCAHCGVKFYKNTTKQKLSKSRLYFCCRKHKDQAQRLGGIQAIMPSHFGPGNGKHSYRQTILNNRPAICERCQFDKHAAAIVIHHKDRNRENNTDENLEVLCANCHAIEHWGEN